MKKHTAVEWLVEKLNQCEPMYSGIQSNEHKEYLETLIEQAKEIEKEQIIYSHISGMQFIAVKGNHYYNNSEQYFNETYNKKI